MDIFLSPFTRSLLLLGGGGGGGLGHVTGYGGKMGKIRATIQITRCRVPWLFGTQKLLSRKISLFARLYTFTPYCTKGTKLALDNPAFLFSRGSCDQAASSHSHT